MYKYKHEYEKAGCQVRDNGYYGRKGIDGASLHFRNETGQTRSQATEGIKVPNTGRGERQT